MAVTTKQQAMPSDISTTATFSKSPARPGSDTASRPGSKTRCKLNANGNTANRKDRHRVAGVAKLTKPVCATNKKNTNAMLTAPDITLTEDVSDDTGTNLPNRVTNMTSGNQLTGSKRSMEDIQNKQITPNVRYKALVHDHTNGIVNIENGLGSNNNSEKHLDLDIGCTEGLRKPSLHDNDASIKCDLRLSNSLDTVDIPGMTVHIARKDSLTVPTAAIETTVIEGTAVRKDSGASSKLSTSSMTSPRSMDARQDYYVVPVPQEEKKSVFSPEDSWIRVAIPYLPYWVAVVCLILNIVVPGSGTIVSGFCIFCCGESRVPAKYDQDLVMIVCVNTWVGCAQLLTVTFMFVGWFWSVAWGIKMVILAVERRAERAEQRSRELQTLALNAFALQHRLAH